MDKLNISEIKELAGDYKRKTSEYDTKGRVTKRDGATLYVKLEGSDIETPVDATTAEASVGDTVSVHVSHNDTHVTGNRTSPAATTYMVVKAKSDLEESIYLQDSKLEAVNADVRIVNSAFQITDGVVTGLTGAVLDSLRSKYLQTDWANIEFADIDRANIEKIFADSGYFKDFIAEDGTIVRKLTAVEIDGDEANVTNLKADSIRLLGPDGLYYALNVSGSGDVSGTDPVELENGLHGSNIIAKTVTAEHLKVDDVIAFTARMANFDIDEKGLRADRGLIELNADGTWHFGSNGDIGESDGYQIAFKVKDGEAGPALNGIFFLHNGNVIGSFQANESDDSTLRTTNAEMLPVGAFWNQNERSKHVDIGCVRFHNRSNGNLSLSAF